MRFKADTMRSKADSIRPKADSIGPNADSPQEPHAVGAPHFPSPRVTNPAILSAKTKNKCPSDRSHFAFNTSEP